MTAWLVVVAVGLGTYAFRAAMFAIVAARDVPAWAQRPLAYVSPAALGALVGGMLLTAHGSAEVPGLAEAGAAIASFATVRRSGNVAVGILTGFLALWAIAAVTG
ncbi:MAG: AzlD domain-containing protein [Acidobacteriota bacterium]